MATTTVHVNADGFVSSLARNLREAANRLHPIDREAVKALVVSAQNGRPAAEVADEIAQLITEEK